MIKSVYLWSAVKCVIISITGVNSHCASSVHKSFTDSAPKQKCVYWHKCQKTGKWECCCSYKFNFSCKFIVLISVTLPCSWVPFVLKKTDQAFQIGSMRTACGPSEIVRWPAKLFRKLWIRSLVNRNVWLGKIVNKIDKIFWTIPH